MLLLIIINDHHWLLRLRPILYLRLIMLAVNVKWWRGLISIMTLMWQILIIKGKIHLLESISSILNLNINWCFYLLLLNIRLYKQEKTPKKPVSCIQTMSQLHLICFVRSIIKLFNINKTTMHQFNNYNKV